MSSTALSTRVALTFLVFVRAERLLEFFLVVPFVTAVRAPFLPCSGDLLEVEGLPAFDTSAASSSADSLISRMRLDRRVGIGLLARRFPFAAAARVTTFAMAYAFGFGVFLNDG